MIDDYEKQKRNYINVIDELNKAILIYSKPNIIKALLNERSRWFEEHLAPLEEERNAQL